MIGTNSDLWVNNVTLFAIIQDLVDFVTFRKSKGSNISWLFLANLVQLKQSKNMVKGCEKILIHLNIAIILNRLFRINQ